MTNVSKRHQLSSLIRYESSQILDRSHPNFLQKRMNLVSPDICEMEEKKSAIFSLPFHKYRVRFS